MVELIDVILVALAVGIASWYTLKYFFELGKPPKDASTGCSGCSSCSPDASQSKLISIKKNKIL